MELLSFLPHYYPPTPLFKHTPVLLVLITAVISTAVTAMSYDPKLDGFVYASVFVTGACYDEWDVGRCDLIIINIILKAEVNL